MKNLGKLKINPEKLMRNDELVRSKGGAEPDCAPGETRYRCFVKMCNNCTPTVGYVCATSSEEAVIKLEPIYPYAYLIECEVPIN